ncbi:hypothetical protein SteCoe_29397 [Stentor coeruleus]|uniref:Uncharacterized protein n=1 Tax=Stentor coeruleus TaxID=5963 RepID=A0A1R2B629_9CILI|nr:hypothetical protein SteCoe_29397 [Stentor coeruleus]
MEDFRTYGVERIQVSELEINNSLPKNYYFDFIESFLSLPKILQHSLLKEIYEIVSVLFADYTFELFCSKEFFDSKATHSILILIRQTGSNKIIGFNKEHLHERYAFENDYRESNKYICASGIVGCIPEFQGKRILTDLNYLSTYLFVNNFPQNNLVILDFYTNPISYYSLHKISKNIIPSPGKSYSKKILDFIIQTANFKGYKSLPFRHPLMVKEDHLIKNMNKQYLKDNYNKLPKEMKFFIDTTGLEPHAALTCMPIIQILKDNSLGLEEIYYDKPKDLDVKVFRWVINNPKI